jgi:tetratricopeptide (TPR) repeat protein
VDPASRLLLYSDLVALEERFSAAASVGHESSRAALAETAASSQRGLVATLTLITGGSAEKRAKTVLGFLCGAFATTRDLRVAVMTDAARWPFRRHIADGLPASGALIAWGREVHEAFPSGQTGSTRLVLTQSTYQLQRWLDWLDGRGTGCLILDADRGALHSGAPEAFAARGPWSRAEIIDVGASDAPHPVGIRERQNEESGAEELLSAAFRMTSPSARLAGCRRAAHLDSSSASVQLALGGSCMEVQDLDGSREAIERAIALAPDWEATHFEHGKLWLRLDDMDRASRAFAEAGRLMPSFSAAFSNLGATLGELDRPEEGLRAFEQAIKYDPNGYTVLSNIGVGARELGRLVESETAFRKVIALAPDFVFGHYNLGHTLFLQGRYQAALSAYVEGQRLDPDKNPRQACRLALVRLAAGDAHGAVRDLRHHTANLPGDLKREILSEAQEILWALLSTQSAMAGWRQIADLVQRELQALA